MAFTIKQNDTRPLFVVALKDDFGEITEAAVNLTTASTAVFNMRTAGGTAVKVSRGGGSISDAVNGEVTYVWQSTDTNTVGTYDAEVEIGWNDGKVETFPNDGYWTINIVDDLAGGLDAYPKTTRESGELGRSYGYRVSAERPKRRSSR